MSKIQCPRCGSDKKAKILYVKEEYVNKEIHEDNDEIYISHEIPESGSSVGKYHCNECGFNFGGNSAGMRKTVRRVMVSVEYDEKRRRDCIFLRTEDGRYFNYISEEPSFGNSGNVSMTQESWKKFVKSVFSCYIMDWGYKYGKDENVYPKWSVKVEFYGEHANLKEREDFKEFGGIRICGAGEYPVYWKKFKKVIEKYSGEML